MFGAACVLSCFSCIWLFVHLRTVAQQAPLSMGFSRQEYWSELPGPSPGYLPDPGIEYASLKSPELALVVKNPPAKAGGIEMQVQSLG